jgi:hypothetical protein
MHGLYFDRKLLYHNEKVNGKFRAYEKDKKWEAKALPTHSHPHPHPPPSRRRELLVGFSYL